MNPRKTARSGAAVLNVAAMAVPRSIPAFAGLSGGTSATASTIHQIGVVNPANRGRLPTPGIRRSAAYGPAPRLLDQEPRAGCEQARSGDSYRSVCGPATQLDPSLRPGLTTTPSRVEPAPPSPAP